MSTYFRRKKMCYFTANKIEDVDYKDIGLINKFIMDTGKMVPSRAGEGKVSSDGLGALGHGLARGPEPPGAVHCSVTADFAHSSSITPFAGKLCRRRPLKWTYFCVFESQQPLRDKRQPRHLGLDYRQARPLVNADHALARGLGECFTHAALAQFSQNALFFL